MGTIGVYVSSFVTNFWLFVSLYGLMFGLGSGMCFMLPIQLAWEYYPENKGLYSGILLGAYGLGPFIFALLTTHLVNPDNLPLDIIVD